MNHNENHQYYSVNNGQYYVKRTTWDFFYILTEFNEWKYNPSLADEFYDVLSGYVEITEEAMNKIICEERQDREKWTIKSSDCVF